tara:strand:+ start:38 stop:493 length:456 start_codon:yes stop_codon:yes gene_type:complete
MEETKVLEFVRRFNNKVEEDLNKYSEVLNYVSNGIEEGVVLPETFLFTTDDNSEIVSQKSLSRLLTMFNSLGKVAEDLLDEDINKFLQKKEREFKEKFPDAKMRPKKTNALSWYVFTSGAYDEDAMDKFLDVFTEDFKYIFEGVSIEIMFP